MEARLYKKLEGQNVECCLCAHRCVIKPSKRGTCEVRENRDGRLVALTYGRAVSMAIDPIEKKPLFHFHPTSGSLSIATVGCNLRCSQCQNYSISQYVRDHPGSDIPGQVIEPEAIARAAQRRECASISYTYSEPTVFYEFAEDVARFARRLGVANVFVTNGHMTPEAIEAMKPWLDAANIDLKSFRADFYRKICKGKLEAVLESIQLMHAAGIWLEVTTLVIPGENDSAEELGDIARFIAGVSPDIPWHVSRFHPNYKMLDKRATPVETLQQAWEIGHAEGLRYVYTGNVWGDDREHTQCPNCRNVVIHRIGYRVAIQGMRDGACTSCGTPIAGVSMP